MIEFTKAQQNAIDARRGTILVSAAAGSGKTAVLVERVIQILLDETHPISPDKLLIVTFTKAAANEMKERISRAITEKIKENPHNAFYKRQKMFLSNATIATIDSFCNKIVKENFQVLDISPDFTTMDDSEFCMLKNDTVSEVLDELYADTSEGAQELLNLFTNGKNDKNLIDSIMSIYNFAVSAPYTEKWLDDHFKCFSDNCPIEDSIWGKYILEFLKKHYEYVLNKMNKIIEDSKDGNEDCSSKLYGAICIDLSTLQLQLNEALKIINEPNCWDRLRNINETLKLPRFKSFKDNEKDNLYFEIKARRDSLKGDFDHIKSLMCCFSNEYNDDMEYLKLVMSSFKQCVLRYGELLSKYQKEKNSYYFSDILHFAIDLLIFVDEDGNFVKTPLAKEISTQFDEILIDEFQDTNDAQNALFNAISKNSNNLFMVGDVKQSIYRFRQAVPENFMELKDKFPEYSKDDDNYPATINLDSNFRSRKGIVDGINFFFDFLMSKNMGEVDYKNGEQLKFGAEDAYSITDNLDTEVHIVEPLGLDKSAFAEESQYIGELIQKYVKSGMLVGKKGEEHPIKYSDICVLLRSANKKSPAMAHEFEELGIPVYYNTSAGFFEKAEVVTVVSMLKVIDNPVSDVPLLSVMLSPMFPFSEDDIAKMRCENKYDTLYGMLKSHYDSNSNVKYFLDTINYLRTLSVTLSISDLIRRIFEITSYDSVVGAMNNGERRILNLSKLISYADNYESNGGNGLSGFLRYMDKLRTNNYDLEEASAVSETQDVVRIMSVHKSKGLEFPVVILGDCNKKFFFDNTVKALVDKNMGIGVLRYDKRLNKEYPTQAFTSVKFKSQYSDLSEEMRVLYVAMTRAKEKLVLVGNMTKPEDNIKSLYCSNYTDEFDNSISLFHSGSYLKWILLALMHHPCFKELPISREMNFLTTYKTDSKIKIVIAYPSLSDDKITDETKNMKADEKILSEIYEKVSYVYPYDYLKDVTLKYTASNMNRAVNIQYLASENPSFMGEEKLTPSQRGILMHRFMEKCNFDCSNKDIDSEIERMVKEKIFTSVEAKALNKNNLKKFFNSNLYNRIVNAQKFLREEQFTLSVPVSFIDELSDKNIKDENAIVQGVIDGLIINGDSGEIIDYKTDRVNSPDELIGKYKSQMKIYKKAAQECFNLKKVTVSLYSFTLSQEILINL